jgi:putative protein kinase ArgK-like GTPase of G3E family
MTGDQGLQPQRTTLSWTRTGIGAAGLTGVLTRQAARSGAAVDILATSLAAVATVGLLLLARIRRDRIATAVNAGVSPVSPRSVAAVTVLVAVTAICVTVSFVAG